MTTSKKVILLGHFGVGKTSLIRRFVKNSFSEKYEVSIGVHILKKDVEIDEKETVSLIIWDLEGTDDIKNVRDSYLLGTHGLIYVFDVTRPSTYENIGADISYIKEKHKNIPLQIIGNKADLIDLREFKALLKKHKILYNYLTSAKTGDNVDLFFLELAKSLR